MTDFDAIVIGAVTNGLNRCVLYGPRCECDISGREKNQYNSRPGWRPQPKLILRLSFDIAVPCSFPPVFCPTRSHDALDLDSFPTLVTTK